ncbi:MAG: class I SAM-dependent methyltransferase [Polyangiaceae bacterium]
MSTHVKKLPILGLGLLGCATTQPQEPALHHHGSAHHGFKDAAAWSREFDDPARDAWQRPDDVVGWMELAPGMVAADIGAGTGYFEARLARAVGASGKVFALDVEQDMVTFMKDRFTREGTSNVEARLCPFDSTGLEPASVDRVLIVDTWHHISERDAYAKHLAEVLRPGGTVTIVDFTKTSDKGPPPEHRVDPETAIGELTRGGFTAKLVDESLPDQYVVVGRK